MASEPARDLAIALDAVREQRLLEHARRGGEGAAGERDRQAAPALGPRDHLERGAPVRGVAVTEQRDRSVGGGRWSAELAHAQRAVLLEDRARRVGPVARRVGGG